MNARRFALPLALVSMLAPAVVAAPASAQSTAQPAPAPRNNVLDNLLGAVFGNQAATDQTLETGWNQGGLPFAQRRQSLEARIEASVANGTLTRAEAEAISDEYEDIVDTEARYAANGSITLDERRDLRARYRTLVSHIDGQAAGDDRSIVAQRADFTARTDTAQRQRQISYAEARRLRSDFETLVALETGYARNGIDARERADLDARLAGLESRLTGSGFGTGANPDRWRKFEAQIAARERAGALLRRDALQLRTELGDLARLDAAYSANGLDSNERSYLERRHAEINARVAGGR